MVFHVHPEVERWLTRYGEETGKAPAETRVLDFGCGNGRAAVPLLQRGYDLFGVDIVEPAVSEGRDLLGACGFDGERLRVIGRDEQFADGAFDFIFSQQVFEHVDDLEVVVSELARMTTPGGWGFHNFPAKYRLLEPHLRMPLVHWLPKNSIRRLAIDGFTRIGVEPPPPPEIPGAGRAERSRFEYEYSVNETFYRPYHEIARTLETQGFSVRSVVLYNPRLDRAGIVRRPPLRRPADWGLRTFFSVNILVRRLG